MLTAHELKEQGNKLFAAGKYKDAAAAYTKAISKNDRVAAYYTNRALCYLKAGDWDAVMQDCRRAIELEPNSVKGHVFLGQALMELNLFDEAVNCLQRADALSKEQKVNFGDEIAQLVRVAKKRRFLKEEAKQIREENELQNYLIALIHSDTQHRIRDELSAHRSKRVHSEDARTNETGVKIQSVSEENEVTADNKMDLVSTEFDQATNGGQPVGENPNAKSQSEAEGESDESRTLRERLEIEAKRRARQVEEVFARVEEKRRKRDVPDYLCGKISFELLRDPVITPSGITYDRRDIEEHLNRVGHFDPVTRAPLTHDQLIANLAMKEVVDNFLEDNPWAVDY